MLTEDLSTAGDMPGQEEMEGWEPEQFLQLIDRKFRENARHRNSRSSMEWGGWSRKMNLVLRKRIESKTDPNTYRLQLVFNYWLLKSEILEMIHKSRFLRVRAREKREKDAAYLKGEVVKGKLEEKIRKHLTEKAKE